MSKTVFRGTSLAGQHEREAQLYTVNDRIVIAIARNGRILDVVSLDPDMADALAASLTDRVVDVRTEREATT